MLPSGYKLNDRGEVIRETQLDEIRRNARQEYEKQKMIEEERKERTRVMIGINGQPVSVKPKAKHQQRSQNVSNLQKIER